MLKHLTEILTVDFRAKQALLLKRVSLKQNVFHENRIDARTVLKV